MHNIYIDLTNNGLVDNSFAYNLIPTIIFQFTVQGDSVPKKEERPFKGGAKLK